MNNFIQENSVSGEFFGEELRIKNNLQIKMMEIFGYIHSDMSLAEKEVGATRWSSPVGEEEGHMASIFGEICERPDIRMKLSQGLSDALVEEVKNEMEKYLHVDERAA